MRGVLVAGAVLALALLSSASAPAAQPTAEEHNRALAERFEQIWNSHNMIPLGDIVTEDVDWVNVDGYRGSGRKAIVDGHARVHADKFKDSVFTVKDVSVALVRPDVAVVHVAWAIRGDRNNDGTPREPREGLFTWLTVRDGGTWRIRASHNSNKATIK